jgi:hypothetical protein
MKSEPVVLPKILVNDHSRSSRTWNLAVGRKQECLLEFFFLSANALLSAS